MHTLGDYFRSKGATEEASKQSGDTWFSEPEIRLRESLETRGLKFEQQKRMSRGDTTVVLDFLIEETLAVEIDGREFHHAPDDALRDSHVHAEHGIWTLRVPGWRARYHPDEVVSLISLRLSELRTRAEVLER
jgi:very-short-patch-repair endonuclease